MSECFACHGKGGYMCAEKKPFTWEDVDLLSACYQNNVVLARYAQDRGDEQERAGLVEMARRCRDLSIRIVAHLPPKSAIGAQKGA